MIRLDIAKRVIDLEIPAATLEARLKKWKAPEPRYRSGVFAKYVALVGSAAQGAITTPGL
jgi:dihydroxy-acid dehydratase